MTKRNEMAYKIGQVLFIVLNKKTQVYPMQVVEIITKQTLQGDDVKYKLQGGTDKSVTVFLDDVDGEVFESAEKARQVLTKRANSQINRLVDAAISKSQQWYGSLGEKPVLDPFEMPSTERESDLADTLISPGEEDEVPTVVLPDGTVAKVKINIPTA
jgi:hypothetical protein